MINDTFLDAKLVFFKSFASELKPFLAEYQTNYPKVPFMYGDLFGLYENVLKHFVKPDCLSKNENNT